jgi:hypothetical protein
MSMSTLPSSMIKYESPRSPCSKSTLFSGRNYNCKFLQSSFNWSSVLCWLNSLNTLMSLTWFLMMSIYSGFLSSGFYFKMYLRSLSSIGTCFSFCEFANISSSSSSSHSWERTVSNILLALFLEDIEPLCIYLSFGESVGGSTEIAIGRLSLIFTQI